MSFNEFPHISKNNTTTYFLGNANTYEESPKQTKSKTQMCTYHLRGNCMHGNNCSFAHDVSELKPITCKYDCDNHTCPFIHTREDIQTYLIRLDLDNILNKQMTDCYNELEKYRIDNLLKYHEEECFYNACLDNLELVDNCHEWFKQDNIPPPPPPLFSDNSSFSN